VNRIYVYGLRENVRYTLLRGQLGAWFKARGIPATRTPRLKGWCVRSERIGDVIALAESDGFEVRMKGELR
jgi:hypothetical protein